MKRIFNILIFSYLVLPVFGSTTVKESHKSVASSVIESESFDLLLIQLKKKEGKFKSEESFLKHVFYKVHNKFLKAYERHASVKDVMTTGAYDCVSGTAIYAFVLNELGYQYKVHESVFHVNISLDLGGKEILFEATDPINGFLNDKDDIEVLANKIDLENTAEAFVQREVGLQELLGLQYLNEAIKLFNNREYDIAALAIDQAWVYYPSDRIENMATLIKLHRSQQLAMAGSED